MTDNAVTRRPHPTGRAVPLTPATRDEIASFEDRIRAESNPLHDACDHESGYCVWLRVSPRAPEDDR